MPERSWSNSAIGSQLLFETALLLAYHGNQAIIRAPMQEGRQALITMNFIANSGKREKGGGRFHG